MGIYSLPWDREEQIRVCVALKNHTFVNYNEKEEGRIEQNLKSYRDLNESEKSYLENLISQYGSSIDI